MKKIYLTSLLHIVIKLKFHFIAKWGTNSKFQFGYVLLFSPSFPLAALFALLNNILEMRVDAFKLCNNVQRPFGRFVKDIGAWQGAMEVFFSEKALLATHREHEKPILAKNRASSSSQYLKCYTLCDKKTAEIFFYNIWIPDKSSW